MLAEMAQFHYDLVQGSFVILVKLQNQDLVLVQESGAEVRVRLQHNMKMCKNRIKKSLKITELLSDISLEVAKKHRE